ncbi:MAG: glutathione-independent formaldehyde dehydrogenase [Paracoccaceae bacterium]|jgi:glutathione-independent formaldehyde dehydrogenase
MADNRGVVYLGTPQVEVQNLAFPKLEHKGKKLPHAVILKLVATNICGSDQHMVRGRTTAPSGLILGHEITGEVVELGDDVEFLEKGDIVSVPFNVACGRCRACRNQDSHVCGTVNGDRAGGAYGYVDMGGWDGGQAEYVMIPYADYNLLKFPDRDKAMEKILDLTCLSDILPTGYHGAVNAGVQPGSTVYVAGAGPVGLACAASAHLLGAAVVIVGDMNERRLAQARTFGCETIDLSKHGDVGEQVDQILGEPLVDAAVDCVGFEASGHGEQSREEHPAVVLNTTMNITRAAGRIGVPGLYVTEDPGAQSDAAKTGNLNVRLGLGWAKAHSLHTGQTPVLRYNRQLMQAILHDKIKIADAVNVHVITLDEAPSGYEAFDGGVARKYVIDPHGLVPAGPRSSEAHRKATK